MSDYLQFGRSLTATHPESRTMYGMLDGQRVWIKQICPPKARIWHVLQRMLAALLRQPILRCTVSPGGPGALAHEAERLMVFKARGFHVPEVLAHNEQMLILSDAGPQLRAWLDGSDDALSRKAALREATRALARVHSDNMTHGRPYVRDMTWDGVRIGFLDLEEDPVRVMPLACAQARDIWLFLGSAARFARVPGDKYLYEEPLIADLWAEYARHADPQAVGALKEFVDFLNPLRGWLERDFMWRRIGNDARQSVFVTRCLYKALHDQD